jgi:RNA-directed DNA polymerase
MSSTGKRRQQKTPDGACLSEEAVNPRGTEEGPSLPAARNGIPFPEATAYPLLEKMLERSNMIRAYKRVVANGGAPGVDGVDVKSLQSHLADHWEAIKQELRNGTYRPAPVKRRDIPKPGGRTRRLGIPTTTDRLIQQALLQVLTPIFDPGFSEHSYGFRPGRRAHDAVRKARQYIEEGYRVVVDIDLEKFFDRVNHDILMARVARKVKDKRVLRLIRSCLEAGMMENGVRIATEEGTPQGGPLSPLLANILLDDLDKELEKRGLRFVRYADDCNIYVKSFRAGQRVMESITRFLERKLRLRVNRKKSAVDRPWRRKFLGFSFYQGKNGTGIRLAPETVRRVKDQIRRRTKRNRTQPMAERIEKLNQYLKGWVGYFALADARNILKQLDEWIRRRLRACLWTQWKRVRTRIRELRALGLPESAVFMIANTRKGPWRASLILNNALDKAYWTQQNLVSLEQRYLSIRKF